MFDLFFTRDYPMYKSFELLNFNTVYKEYISTSTNQLIW